MNDANVMRMIDEEIADLSKAFNLRIREELSEEEMAQVIADNSMDSPVCHTHDYCDANESMISAFKDCGMELELHDDDCVDLWNAAWLKSKAEEYRV